MHSGRGTVMHGDEMRTAMSEICQSVCQSDEDQSRRRTPANVGFHAKHEASPSRRCAMTTR